jgi:hypothetical protein
MQKSLVNHGAYFMKQPHYLALSAEKKDLATLHNPPDEPFTDLTRPPGE